MSGAKYGGYIEFFYSADIVDPTTNETVKELRFVRIDLGTITKISESLSKSGTPNALVSMDVRHNIYIDNANTMTLTVDLERITPSRDATMGGTPPKTATVYNEANGTNETLFCWYDSKPDGNVWLRCLDQQQVTTNMKFAGVSNWVWQNDTEVSTPAERLSHQVYNSSKLWSNAYWIKGFNAINDRWQMKFDGADFVYWPEDDLESYIPEEIRHHVYASAIDWTIKVATPEVIKASLTLTVGRPIRKMSDIVRNQ